MPPWTSLPSCTMANRVDDRTREQMLPVYFSCLIICIVCYLALFSVLQCSQTLIVPKSLLRYSRFSLNLMQMACPRHSAAKCKIMGFIFGCVCICKRLSVGSCAYTELSFECELNCSEFIHFSTILSALMLLRAWEAHQASPVNNALHLVLRGSPLASFQHTH